MPGDSITDDKCPTDTQLCIRVKNTTNIDFDSIDVHFPDQVEKFGGLSAGQQSDYRKIERAYRYAYTEALSGERRFVLQPVDFVGENYLQPGLYTYHYSVNEMDEPVVTDEWTLHGYMGVKLEEDARSD